MPRLALIVNPFASAVTDARVEAVVRELGSKADVEVRRTTHPGHAVELVSEAGEQFDAVVVFSGDGGFNEALNGLAAELPIGFLPGGGTNVLSRALGLSRDPVEAARQVAAALAAGHTRRISVGRANGRRFGFAAGLGFDAELVRRVDQLGRADDGRRPHDSAYALAAAKLIRERRGLEPVIEVDGLGRAVAALVANCDPYTYFGPLALRVAPQAQFELGLDLVAPRRLAAGALARYLAYTLAGRGQATAADVLYVHDADRFELRCVQPTALQVDGEDLGDVEHAVFEAEREAVSVLVPVGQSK
jgi:diacylglycerol kinase family enzyme